jgi:hypothetical protein
MRALVGCEDGLYTVEVGVEAGEDELLEAKGGAALTRARPLDLVPPWAAGQALDADVSGSTIVLLLERRPPLLVSHDTGATWSERGSGLPAGRAVALGENPDDVLYAARNRIHVSRDGGVFWRAVAVELPEIKDLAWALED